MTTSTAARTRLPRHRLLDLLRDLPGAAGVDSADEPKPPVVAPAQPAESVEAADGPIQLEDPPRFTKHGLPVVHVSPAVQKEWERTQDTGKREEVVAGIELTPLEASVVMASAEPSFYRLTAEEKAIVLGISRRTYFRVMSRPQVRQTMQSVMGSLLTERAAEVVAALADTAARPGREGTADRRMFFELLHKISGLGAPKVLAAVPEQA